MLSERVPGLFLAFLFYIYPNLAGVVGIDNERCLSISQREKKNHTAGRLGDRSVVTPHLISTLLIESSLNPLARLIFPTLMSLSTYRLDHPCELAEIAHKRGR